MKLQLELSLEVQFSFNHVFDHVSYHVSYHVFLRVPRLFPSCLFVALLKYVLKKGLADITIFPPNLQFKVSF